MLWLLYIIFVSTISFSESHNTANSEAPPVERLADTTATSKGYGIRFSCSSEENRKIKGEIVEYLKEIELQGKGFINLQESRGGEILEYTLNSSNEDTDTFGLKDNSVYDIKNTTETYANQRGRSQTASYASAKEIFLALAQRGRTTEFSGKSCKLSALKDHIGIRQNISRWAERAWFTFPEDADIKRNGHFWNQDNWRVNPGKSPIDAIQDAFTGKIQYALACTKAVQLIMAQGILDYYKNVKKDPDIATRLESEIGDEPVSSRLAPRGSKEGLLVERQHDIPWNNWVPGDW